MKCGNICCCYHDMKNDNCSKHVYVRCMHWTLERNIEMKQKMNKLLGLYKLPNRMKEDEAIPKILFIYKDRIEIETWTLKFEEAGSCCPYHYDAIIKKCRKKFDYHDIILMNETINAIVRPKK